MVKYALFFVFCLFSFLGCYLYFYLGGYKDVSIETISQPKLRMLYLEHQGEYHKILDTIRKVESWAETNSVRCSQTFGHYLDDPESGPADRLRSHGGCIVNQALEPSDGLAYKEAQTANYLYAKFTGAPSIGPFKVYPDVEDYAAENRIRLSKDAIEVYTLYGQGKVLTEYYFRIIE